MDQLKFQYEVLRIRSDHIKIGQLLDYVNISCDEKLKSSLRAILYWLKSEQTPLFMNKKHQKSFDRKNWHEAAELMGLKHFTVEYTQCRHFCDTHKKYCSKWRKSAGEYSSGQCYDSDHECSGDDKYRDVEEEFCLAEERIMNRRNVYILAPELQGIDSVDELKNYLNVNGYMNKPPFHYPYRSNSEDDY
jgi:hypothetical protein